MVSKDPKIPLGHDFLAAVRDQEGRCEVHFDEWLPNAGVKAPRTVEALGAALAYLDALGCGWWGCAGEGHTNERLIARATSNARAALRLLRAGYYDEAFSLVRQLGEVANLLCLFVQSKESQSAWRAADEKKRGEKFRAGVVQKKLEKLELPLPMDQNLYRQLSAGFVHANPEHAPQDHNPVSITTMGAYFQPGGALPTLNHLGGLVGYTLWLAVQLATPRTDQAVIARAALQLLRSIGGVSLLSLPASRPD